MKILVSPFPVARGDAAPVEVVERKGAGHPDTICDALAEEFSIALSRFYLDRFGTILHHNVDKALLVAGRAEPAFGGGEVLAPFEVILSGRAVQSFRGIGVPVQELAEQAGRAWLQRTLRALDFDRHALIRCVVHPGSAGLRELFERKQHVGQALANDTSCGVGHYPQSTLERMVLAVEHRLNAPISKERVPSLGEDVKVMGVRTGKEISLTIACAQIDRHLGGLDDYRRSLEAAAATAREVATVVQREPVEVAVNTGDDLERGHVFLTVTGTSAEAGDDGAAGRGNRVGGLITPYRAMTMESAAGKNPITHVGKLYNALAWRIARAVTEEVAEVAAAECFLVSQIGRPVADPALVHLVLESENPNAGAAARPRIEALVREHLTGTDELWRSFLGHAITVY